MLIFDGRRPLLLLGVAAAFPLAAFAVPLAVPSIASSSGLGFWCGVAAAAIILFEFVLWLMKRCRGWRVMRWLPRASFWLKLHLWAGLAAIPLAIVHSNFRFGGWLTSTTMWHFLIVSASGVWGMLVQQFVPRRLLQDVPEETVAALGGVVEGSLRDEALRIAERLAAAIPGPRLREQVAAFRDNELLPYLDGGSAASPLGNRQRCAAAFAQLAAELPAGSLDDLRALERCAEARRQLDRQRWLDGILHGWLMLHVPLSFALLVVLAWHIVVGLKLW